MVELVLVYEEESDCEREDMELGRWEVFDKEMEVCVKVMNFLIVFEEIEGVFEEVREVIK